MVLVLPLALKSACVQVMLLGLALYSLNPTYKVQVLTVAALQD